MDWFAWAGQKIERDKQDRERFKKLYSARARKVVRIAIKEAETEGCGYIGTEHLLLSLVLGADTELRVAPKGLRLNVEKLRSEILAVRGAGMTPRTGRKVLFTPRMSRIISSSRKEALALKQECVEPEHLLLALMAESGGIAANVLKRLAVNRGDIAATVKAELSTGK